MRISDWSSDVCSSDLRDVRRQRPLVAPRQMVQRVVVLIVESGGPVRRTGREHDRIGQQRRIDERRHLRQRRKQLACEGFRAVMGDRQRQSRREVAAWLPQQRRAALYFARSEEHTSELQSLMRTSYAVFCLKNKKHKRKYTY